MLAPPRLRKITLPGSCPEDVVIDTAGRALVGTKEGDLVRISADFSTTEVLANTGGRPLGLELLSDGRLLICDPLRGLLAYDFGTNSIEVLLDEVLGDPITMCNNASVADDGTIYFSESTTRHGFDDVGWDLVENIPSGRLVRFTPGEAAEVLLAGVKFPNGVAVAPDQASVVFAESTGFRLVRYWLTGDAAGTTELFSLLPGVPDNISVGSDGLLWVALPSIGVANMERLLRLPRVVKRILVTVAEKFNSKSGSWGLLAFDFSGNVVHAFRGSTADYRQPTGVRERNGVIVLGSLVDDGAATFEVGHA